MGTTASTSTDSARSEELLLSGVRIVDLTDGVGDMASRLLADLGAEVIRVEPTAGSASRRFDPRVGRLSIYDETHNSNKKSITLNLPSTDGHRDFLRLLQTTDILIEGLGPKPLAALGLDLQDLRRREPTLVVVSVSDFGRTGPYRDWAATEWVHVALGGVLSRSGLPGREPLIPPGPIATESASLTAAWAAILAYYNRLLTGAGDDIDVSIFESTVSILDPGFGMAGSAAGGVPTSDGPRGRPDASHLYPIFPCADGYARLCILSPRQWRGMFEWMGKPEEFADPELAELRARYSVADTLYPAIGRFLAAKTREEVVEEGQRFGVPSGALLQIADVLTAEHYRDRNTFADIDTPQGLLRVPNGLLEIDGNRAGLRSRAPKLGEHTEDVLVSLPSLRSSETTPAVIPLVRHRPLDGIRVLDFGVIVAGGETGRLLADMGAEVIKIENTAFPDGSRQSLEGVPITPVFAWGHRNKESIGIDLRDPTGLELLHTLVAQADVVLSNFKPGTMDKLGLSYEALSQINPRIIVSDSSAFGSSGPWSARLGYGPLVRASTGLSLLWRYDDATGGFSDASTIYPDHAAARVSVIGVLAQLVRRLRTGRGGTVSVAQAEVIMTEHSILFALESLRSGSIDELQGGRTPDAPRGIFPCAGDDEWVVIDIRDSRDWQNLAAAIGRPELAGDEGLSLPEQRHSVREELDHLVGEWTSTRSPRDVTEELQSAGVPAGMMLRLPELIEDAHLSERRTFRDAHHPLIERPLPSENTPGHFRNIPDVEMRPAPLMGQDTRSIASRLLGLTDGEIDDLLASKVLEETLPPSVEPEDRVTETNTKISA